MASQSQKTKAAAQTGIYLLIVFLAVIMANLFVSGMHKRIDVTKNERFTLSQGSGHLVSSLKEEMHADVYIKTGLPQLDLFVRDLKHLLSEYEQASKGKFTYKVIEPKTEDEKKAARDAKIQEQPFGEASATGDSKASITQGFLGIVFKYGSEEGVIPQLHPARGDGLEFFISNKIRELRDVNDDRKYRIGVLTGKEELKLTDTNLVPKQGPQGGPSLQQILTQNFPFYTIESVDITGDIDPELVGLIMTQPSQDYTEEELKKVDDFLMLGNKSLAVIASAVNLKAADATMQAELNLHGIDTLLSGYGIQVNKDAVFDHGAQFRVPVMTSMGAPQWLRHPGVVHVVDDPRFIEDEARLDTAFPAFFRMAEIMVPFPSSITLLEDKQPSDVKIKAVARTTPAATLESSDTVDMSVQDNFTMSPPFEQHIIAATAEGVLKSAYSDSKAKASSRVLVIASSEFITNPFAFSGNPPPTPPQMQQFGGMPGDKDLLMLAQPYAQTYLTQTIIAMKNTLDWISGDADLIAASAKLLGEATLTYSDVKQPEFKAGDDEEALKKKDEEYSMGRKKMQNKIQFGMTFGVPVFFILVGLWRFMANYNRVNAAVSRTRRTRRSTKGKKAA